MVVRGSLYNDKLQGFYFQDQSFARCLSRFVQGAGGSA